MNGLREALYDLRYRWLGVRIGGADATMRGQWLVLSVSLVIVFACFFAVGRFFHTGAGSSAGAPSAQVAAGGHAIPSGLSGGSPAAGAVPVSIAVQPRVQPASQPASSEAQVPVTTTPRVLGVEGSAEAPVSQTPPATVSEPAPTQAAAAPHKSESTSSRHAAPGRARSKPSTGATFDTSE